MPPFQEVSAILTKKSNSLSKPSMIPKYGSKEIPENPYSDPSDGSAALRRKCRCYGSCGDDSGSRGHGGGPGLRISV